MRKNAYKRKRKMITSTIKKEFKCDINKLWNIITDNTKYNWRSDLSIIEIISENQFIEYTKNNFPTHFTITLIDHLKEYRFSLSNSNIEGNWIGTFKLMPNNNVEITLTEHIEVKNIIMNCLLNLI